MNKNDDNLIEFPDRKRSIDNREETSNLRFDLENRKVMLSGSLASILVIMTLLNTSIFSVDTENYSAKSVGDRHIASVSVTDRNTKWEHDLAKSLNQKVKRGIASIGREPSSKEKFKIGELEGKYSVHFSEGSLRNLSFVKDARTEEQPKYVNDRYEFLVRNRAILPIDFKSASLFESKVDGEGRKEIYRLVSSDSLSHVDVEFKLDQYERLISMTIKN